MVSLLRSVLPRRLLSVLAGALIALSGTSLRADVFVIGEPDANTYVIVEVEVRENTVWEYTNRITWILEYTLGPYEVLDLPDTWEHWQHGDPETGWIDQTTSYSALSVIAVPIVTDEPPDNTGGGGGGGPAPPEDPTNLKIEGDDASLFVSWTNPSFNFSSTTVVWSRDWDFAAAWNDPNRRATTTDSFFSIEGLTNGASYNVWVVAGGSGGYSPGQLSASATPSTPSGFNFAPDSAVADMTDEETAADSIGHQRRLREREMRTHSENRGPTLRSVLTRLNVALTTAITPLIFTAQVHEDTRQIGVRIAREAYLLGEITAEQYLAIADHILNMQLPVYGMYQGQAEVALGTVRNEALAQVQQAIQANQNGERAPRLIYRFGNATRVAPARGPQDFDLPVGSPGSVLVGPEAPPLPRGASAWSSISPSYPDYYWALMPNVILPAGIGIVADGADVVPWSNRGFGHHTIFPNAPMSLDRFNELMRNLPWHRMRN